MSTIGTLKVVKLGEITVVVFGPAQRRLDEVGLEDIRRQLVEIAEAAAPPWLILDLAATEFFGSSFIDVLFRVWKRVKAQPTGKFAISGLHEYCREVLEITQVDRLFSLYATRDEAVEAMSAA